MAASSTPTIAPQVFQEAPALRRFHDDRSAPGCGSVGGVPTTGFTVGGGYGALSEPLRTVQILRLRRKLDTNPSASRIVRTEHGVGYMFPLPVEPL